MTIFKHILLGIGLLGIVCLTAFIGLFWWSFGRNVNIPETGVGNRLEHEGKTFTLSINGHSYPNWNGDGMFIYYLTLHISEMGHVTHIPVFSDKTDTEEEIHLRSKDEYTLSIGDEIPHVSISHEGDFLGFCHTDRREFIRWNWSRATRDLTGYAVDLETTPGQIARQIDLAKYDQLFHVDKKIGWCSKQVLVSWTRELVVDFGAELCESRRSIHQGRPVYPW